MNVENRDPVMRRKVAPPAEPAPVADPALSGVAAGLRRAFARAVSKAAPLVADRGTIHRSLVSQAELLDMLDGDAFVGLLSDGEGATGLAVFDQSGFSAVIEAMTIGRLSRSTPVPRRPTPTDASLLADLLDATLDDLTEPGAVALRFHRAVADHRLLAVLIDDQPYDFVRAEFTMMSGDVERSAMIAFALPQTDEQDATATAQVPPETGTPWSDALAASVMAAPACLRAELGRLTMPLSEVLDLGVGSALILPLSNLEDVRLVSLDGDTQSVGRLGQSRGMRAVRLTCWPGGAPEPMEMTNDSAGADETGVGAENAVLAPQSSLPSAPVSVTPEDRETGDPPA